MDERLDAGRHHLSNGTRALEQGFLDEGRSHFEAALLQFRGPELRLGEAHALRGLAKVELSVGHTHDAATRIGEARRAYQQTAALLEQHGAGADIAQMVEDARRGEASCLVIAAEIASRQGDLKSAEVALTLAEKLVNDQSLPRGPVAMQLGRLALRNGDMPRAHGLFTTALDAFAEDRDEEGQVDALCAQAEVHRIKREVSPAEQVLGRALALARGSRIGLLEGKVLAKLADVRLQARDLNEAERLYAEAVPLLHGAGSTEAEAFALVGWGVSRSLLDEPEALDSLMEGTRLLALLDDRDGFAAASYRLAEHAVRMKETGLALVAAEASRRAWSAIDPVEGVGRAMRMLVKALSVGQQTRSAYLVAKARAAVAGAVQPNAHNVVAHFSTHLDGAWKARVDALSGEQLVDVALARISELIDETIGSATIPEPGETGELVAWADRAGELALAAGEARNALKEQLEADRRAEAEAARKAEESSVEAEADEEPVIEPEPEEAPVIEAEPEDEPVFEAEEEPPIEAEPDEEPVFEAEPDMEPVLVAESEDEPEIGEEEELGASASEAIAAALEAEEQDETLRVRRSGDSAPQNIDESDWNDLFNDLNTDEVPISEAPSASLPDSEVLTDEVLDAPPPPRRTPAVPPDRDREPGS